MSGIVAVHGSYFADNFGDTLLVRLACDQIAERVGRERVYLAVPGNLKEQRSIGYPVLKMSQRSDVNTLVFAGGGYLGEPDGSLVTRLRWSLRNYRRHLAWIRSFPNARIYVLGVGFGPLSGACIRNAVRCCLLRRAEIVLLRDQESMDYLRRYEIKPKRVGQCVDWALRIDKSSGPRKKRLALHVGNLTIREISIIIGTLRNEGVISNLSDCWVIADQPRGLSEQVRTKYQAAFSTSGYDGNINFMPYQNVDHLLESLASFDLVVTSKLHVGIVTIAQGGNVISVPVHDKTPRLYKQLGLERFCIPRRIFDEQKLVRGIRSLTQFSPQWDVVDRGVADIDVVLEEIGGRF